MGVRGMVLQQGGPCGRCLYQSHLPMARRRTVVPSLTDRIEAIGSTGQADQLEDIPPGYRSGNSWS
jgi:hypothetical protein